jgi:hypothetical protein
MRAQRLEVAIRAVTETRRLLELLLASQGSFDYHLAKRAVCELQASISPHSTTTSSSSPRAPGDQTELTLDYGRLSFRLNHEPTFLGAVPESVSVVTVSDMRMRNCFSFVVVLASVFLNQTHAQRLQTTEYVTLKNGRGFVVAGAQGAYLERALALTPELTVTTNGVIEIARHGKEQLTESKRLTLDGFWISSDGTLQAFKPHYLMKNGALYVVKSGVLARQEQDVAFANGNVLRLDGFLASGTRLIRLQDGQRLDLNGEVIPALDHIMMVNGRLVLQKDGSIVPLASISAIGMSEGTRVTGAGVITLPRPAHHHARLHPPDAVQAGGHAARRRRLAVRTQAGRLPGGGRQPVVGCG